MTAKYRYEAFDLRTNAVYGSIPLSGVTWTKALMSAGTCSGSYAIAADKMSFIKAASQPGRCGLTVFRNESPVWGGICWTRKYDSGTRKVNLNYSTFETYWAKRYQRQSRTFYSTAGLLPVPHTADGEQIGMVRWLFNNANAFLGGDIGITIDNTVVSGFIRDRSFNYWDFKYVLDEAYSIAQLDGGFEFFVDVYVKPDGTMGRRVLFGYPKIGRSASTTDLTFSLPGNMSGFVDSEDAQSGSNLQWAIGAGEGSTQMEASAAYAPQIQIGYPLIEDAQSYKDVSVSQTLRDHAAADLKQRVIPINVIGAVVNANSSPNAGSYQPGDYAKFQINDPWYGSQTLTTVKRISAMSTKVPDQGDFEQTTLTLGDNTQAS